MPEQAEDQVQLHPSYLGDPLPVRQQPHHRLGRPVQGHADHDGQRLPQLHQDHAARGLPVRLGLLLVSSLAACAHCPAAPGLNHKNLIKPHGQLTWASPTFLLCMGVYNERVSCMQCRLD